MATCVRCGEQYVRLLPGWLPVDEDLILQLQCDALTLSGVDHERQRSLPEAAVVGSVEEI